MAPLKRRRPHDAIPDRAPLPEPITTRRATRQTSIAPLPAQSDPEPKRRRRRTNSNEEQDGDAGRTGRGAQAGRRFALNALGRPAAAAARARGKENIPLPDTDAENPKPTPKPIPSRNTRHGRSASGISAKPPPAVEPSDTDNTRPEPARPANHPLATRSRARSPNTAVDRRDARPVPPTEQHQRPTPEAKQALLAPAPTPTPAPAPGPASTTHPAHPRKPPSAPPQRPSQQPPLQKPDTPGQTPSARTDRNIDKIVLGDLCFRAWYPSYYGKEVLGDITGSSAKFISPSTVANKEAGCGKAQSRRDRDSPMLDRLYVCPCCFKYSKEVVPWLEHVRICEALAFVPGDKIYTHPKGRRKVLIPSARPSKSGRGRRGNAASRMVETIVQDEGEWSIWEVDGEKDMLFCQNLSLFAKLFLDNKSVFFDVTGFNYFLLVYTPPPVATIPTDPSAEPTEISQPRQPRGQIVGFFSKEKMSWDNNNLACILVFPPWQRKGLGSLLMGVSYEISRREGLLGGPEKPISDLGKKGYKRFWAGEIARWLLSLDTGGGGQESEASETVVDVDACSRATWIAPDDCLLALREMGVAEDAGAGPPPAPAPSKEEEPRDEGEPAEAEAKHVQRVRISKEAVRHWVAAAGISLERTCDPQGFVDGYALRAVAGEDEDS